MTGSSLKQCYKESILPTALYEVFKNEMQCLVLILAYQMVIV